MTALVPGTPAAAENGSRLATWEGHGKPQWFYLYDGPGFDAESWDIVKVTRSKTGSLRLHARDGELRTIPRDTELWAYVHCCPGEPASGDPHGLHTYDCPVYQQAAAAVVAQQRRSAPPPSPTSPPQTPTLTLRVGQWVTSSHDLTSLDNDGWNQFGAPAGTPGLIIGQKPAGSYRYEVLFPGSVLSMWQRPCDLTAVQVRVEVLAEEASDGE